MKIDRLLSIIIYLLKHEVVTATTLAQQFQVSIRTIQRDIDTIGLAGIPIVSRQGSLGGYSIMSGYQLDTHLIGNEELCHIITALQSMFATLHDKKIEQTLEKIRVLFPIADLPLLKRHHHKLSIDFTSLGGSQEQQKILQIVREAVETERALSFIYTNNKLEQSSRIVEPLTVAFRWRSWYVFCWCRTRKDYRLFKIARMRMPVILPEHFIPNHISFEEYEQNHRIQEQPLTEFSLRFDPIVRPFIEEYYDAGLCFESEDGGIILKTSMEEDSWLYGFILSYGNHVTVLHPPALRETIRELAVSIAQKYESQ